MSLMYKAEVPLYGNLVEIVKGINADILEKCEVGMARNDLVATAERLSLERHGAIRLGTPFEMKTVCRIFRLLGMSPHGYYNLSVAGLPMHATCFRPTDVSSLDVNPFRVFTTLLRPELLASGEARELSWSLLTQRNIFTRTLMEVLDIAERQGGRLTEKQAQLFITQALAAFSWKPVAASTIKQYNKLKAEHPILADISCFSSAHINHLTPRTLDISGVQEAMSNQGMAVKDRIEGPPARQCPILLRQTSFLALEESVKFRQELNASNSNLIQSSHKARFGEIEQRGAAVTQKGRELYDRLLDEIAAAAAGLCAQDADAKALEVFKQFPDTWEELRTQGLVYFEYKLIKKPEQVPALKGGYRSLLEQLIAQSYVQATPITYEDFLPLSAAGIFQSNLQATKEQSTTRASIGPSGNQAGLEESMGVKITDLDDWYLHVQRRSLVSIAKAVGHYVDTLF